jgi:hypothetical protein
LPQKEDCSVVAESVDINASHIAVGIVLQIPD